MRSDIALSFRCMGVSIIARWRLGVVSLPNEMARPRCVLAMTVGGASRSASLPDEHGATPFLKLPSCHGGVAAVASA
ncbi:MAG: hypothetical protein ACK46D_05685, partial [Roseiflexaceae bacterium]